MLARQLTAERALPDALLDRIVAQTDGMPFFIEEVIKAVLERFGAWPHYRVPMQNHAASALRSVERHMGAETGGCVVSRTLTLTSIARKDDVDPT